MRQILQIVGYVQINDIPFMESVKSHIILKFITIKKNIRRKYRKTLFSIEII